MIFPNDPDLSSLSREQVINLLLASIGFEECSLAYMIKSEADLLQLALGKASTNGKPLVKSLDDLLRINRSVNHTLQTITNKESILLSKLKEVANLIEEVPLVENLCSATVQTGEAVVDVAYINNEIIDFDLNVDKIDISFLGNCTMEDDRIELRFSYDTCPFLTITLVENTANILCSPNFDRALIRVERALM